MRRLLIVLNMLGACTSAGPQVVGAPHTTQGAGPVTFAPASEPAMHYNEPPQAAPHTALGDAVTAAVNRDRAAAGLPMLSWNDRVAGVARGHSEEMRRTHVVAHVLSTTGSAADRVRAANIKTGVVLEDVAHVYGLKEAHDGLMNSPGDRANMMSGEVTHVGIGVTFGDEVSGRREMFITQVFTRVPPKIERAGAIEAVRQKLAAARPALVVQPTLSEFAQKLVDAVAAGETFDVAYQRIKHQLEKVTWSYLRLASVINATANLETLEVASLLGGSASEEVGIGVAQGPHPELGDNAIWVVLLFGDRRP